MRITILLQKNPCVQFTYRLRIIYKKKHLIIRKKITQKGGILIKTRSHLYGQEATELLRIITMYPGLSVQQLQKFYPGKEEVTNSILSHLIRQGRIYYEQSCSGYFSALAAASKDKELTDAVWVLLDFLDRIEFHSVSDFPVKLIFFADGELYEIVSIPTGQEALLSHLLKQQNEGTGKRILMVEHPKQIAVLDIPLVSGFCTVDADGKVNYYKKQ